MTKAEYEASRPQGEQKLDFPTFVLRAYIDDKGSLHVMCHRKDSTGQYEELPLAYMLGSNALIMQGREEKEQKEKGFQEWRGALTPKGKNTEESERIITKHRKRR